MTYTADRATCFPTRACVYVVCKTCRTVYAEHNGFTAYFDSVDDAIERVRDIDWHVEGKQVECYDCHANETEEM
jgi:hypothetical protein